MSEEKYNINDLTIKLQVLSKGIIDERQKTQSYINRIKEYEEIISKKDNDIVKLNKEKYDLQTKLLSETESLPKSQTETAIHDVVNHLFKINENEYEEFERIQETNNQLKAQRTELTQKLVDTPEMFAWTVVIVLISFIVEKGFLWLLDKITAKITDGYL